MEAAGPPCNFADDNACADAWICDALSEHCIRRDPPELFTFFVASATLVLAGTLAGYTALALALAQQQSKSSK